MRSPPRGLDSKRRLLRKNLVMTRAPRVVAPDTLAAEALRLMSERAPAVTVLFVVEDERPVGILHVHDLLRAGVM